MTEGQKQRIRTYRRYLMVLWFECLADSSGDKLAAYDLFVARRRPAP